MEAESVFRALFIALFAFIIAFRLYYQYKAGNLRERTNLMEAEGRLVASLRLLVGLPFYLGLFAYIFVPQAMGWSMLPLPLWLRWLGAGLAVLSTLLLFWINHVLSTNFSGTLRIRQDHTLITAGPYRWVRHPMYTVILLMLIGFFLLSANWFIGLTGLLSIVLVMVLRTPREEAMMTAKFGDEYRAYMQRTGRFLPRLRLAP
jgi:protein-S-isoprenylcysteine O-methyltransferase Ste14